MWESPIYKLNKLVSEDRKGRKSYQEIVIDVTGSAPSFADPGKTLSHALDEVFVETGLSRRASIMDFGAGKLRVALHLLQLGYHICAVEYGQLFKDSRQAESNLQAALKFRKRFGSLVYPNQFQQSKDLFDLVLMINVTNIMPVPAERLLVLAACHEKLKPGAYFLWYTQRGDAFYKGKLIPEFQIGDGYFLGRNAKYKTFYREFTTVEIDGMMRNAGFEFVRSIDATSRNQARLFRRLDARPLGNRLIPGVIRKAGVIDDRIELPDAVEPRRVTQMRSRLKGNPDPVVLRIDRLLIEELHAIPTGTKHAKRYRMHVAAMMEYLFTGELRNFNQEVDIGDGLKRLDIVASNPSHEGFFRSLKEAHNITCPTIPIECKNYSGDIANAEVDQLNSRLGRKLGRAGIIAYRKADKRARLLARCKLCFDSDEKLIIPLSDRDFVTLIELKASSDVDGLFDFLDNIVNEVKWKKVKN